MGILAGILKWLLVMLIVCGAIVVICYVAQDKEKRGEKKRRSGLWQLSWQLPAVREEQEGVGVYCQNFFRESARVCSSTTS